MPTIGEDADGFDYDAAETMVVSGPAQLRAVGHDLRTTIIHLLRDRARSTHELAAELGIPKGTVGHHLKVLERAGLIRVVRTRQVRAVTEKFYGRTARLFLFETEDPADSRAIGAAALRRAAAELELAPAHVGFGLVRARLTSKDAQRLERRMKKLLDDFRAAETPGGVPSALAVGMWATEKPDA